MKKTIVAFVVCVLATTSLVNADVVFDSGTPQRPLSVTGLNLANGVFDASFDYTTQFGDAVILQEPITGSSDTDVMAALRLQLDVTGIDSSATWAFVSVIAPSSPFATGNAVTDTQAGSSGWGEFRGGPLFLTTADPRIALVTFTPAAAVPEPSSFLCIGLMALVAGGLNWSRKRRQI